MPIEAHPTRDEILAYSTGRLDEHTSERIAEHISTCDTCRSVLTAVDDGHDSVVARLRRGVPPDPYAQEPECRAALAAAKGRLDALWPQAAEPRSASAPDDPSGFATIDRILSRDRLPPAEDLPQLGDYQLLEKLGQGGMGAVYKARHLRLDRVVALKILPKERTQDQAAVARFAREMKAVGQLNHPNIVQAHDARDIDGTTVLVMEYVDGHDLSEVVRLAKPLRIADACELVRQAAVGLQHAHEHGLVHRDVKPSNLMLAAESHLSLVSGQLLREEKELNAESRPLKAIVKILDLGLARLASDAPANGELTNEGQAMGTADYMAPEQISDSHSADIRADIYSLGCTLYKLLTGQPPFPGPKYKGVMDKMTGHLRDEPRPIGELRSDVPPGLVAVLQRMMAKDRQQRYATPREVAAALAPFAAGANLDHLARCVAAAEGGEPLPAPSDRTVPFVPLTSTTSSPLAPVLRGAGPGVRGDAASVQAIGTAIRQAIRGPALLIALGLFGVLIALGVVIIRILHNDGTQTEVAIPAGSSATVNPDGSVDVKLPDGSPQKLLVTKRTPKRLPQGQWVPLLKTVEDLQDLQRRGRGTVAYINNALQMQDAAVSYPTLAIDLVIRVNLQIHVDSPSSARVTLREQPNGSYAAVLEDGKSLIVGVTEKDQWRELKKAAVSIAPDQLVALEFSAVGDVLSVSLDGKQVCEVRDTTHRSGAPGLAATKGVTLFKDIQVKVLRGEEEIVKADKPAPAKPIAARLVTEDDEEDVPWDLPKDAPPPAIAPFDAAQARRHQEAWAKYLGVPVEHTNSLGMKFALIPPGEFEFPFTNDGGMEVTPDTPRERLRLVRPIYAGTTEVTFEQFKKFADATGYQTDAERMGGGKVPPDWKPTPEAIWKKPWQQSPAADEPVTQVSANDATAFCDWLTILECGDLSPLSSAAKPLSVASPKTVGGENETSKERKKESGDESPHSKGQYRLLREAEWYFAARAGSTSRYVLGDTPADLTAGAWFGFDLAQLKDNGVRPVGQKKPNPFGLFDTLGNVWELCRDRQYILDSWERRIIGTPSLRGGAAASSLACASESHLQFEGAGSNTGFRVMRELPIAVSPQEASRRPDSTPEPDDSIVFPVESDFRRSARTPSSAGLRRSPGVRTWSIELAGHRGLWFPIAWSPRGDLIATAGCEDGSIRLWDRQGHLQKVLLGHGGQVCSVVFSPDGARVASSDMVPGQGRGQARIWDVSTGACLEVIPCASWARCVAFSPNGQNLGVVHMGAGGRLVDIDLRAGRRVEWPLDSYCNQLIWTPDGSRLVTREERGRFLRIWDATTHKKVAELKVSDAQGKAVQLGTAAWSFDGRSIAVPCSDGAWRIWDGETFELRETLGGEGDSPITNQFTIANPTLFWKKNGQLVTVATPNRLITWDVAKRTSVAEVGFPADAPFALSPDQTEIVAYRGYLDFLDAETGKSLRRGTNRGNTMATNTALSPDGERIVTWEEWGMAEIWNADTGRPVARNVGSGPRHCTWQPSGRFIVASKSQNPGHELSLYDAVTMVAAFTLKTEGKGAMSHAWSPDGKLVAAADVDNTIRVWDIAKREVISNLVRHEGEIQMLAWSPDGKLLASRSADKTVRLWDPVSGRLQQTYTAFPEPMADGKFRRGLAWTPDSQGLWIALNSHAVQLDVATGKFSPMERFSVDNVVNALAVSPDGQHLLAREQYDWTFLRTIGTDGPPSRRLLGNGLGRYPVWHPDSRRFLGALPELGRVVTFDIQSNRRLGTLFPWITGDHWLCVSPEGHIRGGHFEPNQTKFDPADTAIPASLKEQIVYVALLDDGSQVTLSPDEFAARFGWKNDPNQAYLLGPTP